MQKHGGFKSNRLGCQNNWEIVKVCLLLLAKVVTGNGMSFVRLYPQALSLLREVNRTNFVPMSEVGFVVAVTKIFNVD